MVPDWPILWLTWQALRVALWSQGMLSLAQAAAAASSAAQHKTHLQTVVSGLALP